LKKAGYAAIRPSIFNGESLWKDFRAGIEPPDRLNRFDFKAGFSLPKSLLPLLAGALMVYCVTPASSGTIKDYRELILDGHQLKWGAPVLGAGAVVTYALADKAMTFVGARNCKSIAPVDGVLAANRVDEKAFQAELAAALAGWQAVADISFRPADPVSADIIIGAEVEPLGRAFTNVVYDEASSGSGPRRLRQSVICLNPAERWKVGFDGNLSTYDLRYTLMHEIGHAIGLDHPAGRNAVMDFAYRERFRVLQPGDIAGVTAIYGQPKPAAELPVIASDEKAPGTIAR